MVPGSFRPKAARRWLRIAAALLALIVWITLLPQAALTRAAGSFDRFFPLVQGGGPVALTFPNPDQYTWDLVTGGLSGATGMTVPGDGSGRLFVTQRSGQIRIIKNGALLATPFLDISNKITTNGGEQGLLGLAFDPNYPSNGRFFIYYVATDDSIVVSRYARSANNPDLANSASESILLTQSHPDSGNHYGGQMAFGPDGYLYISVGDGGPGGDPNNNAQNLNTLLGKILRIDVSGASGYSIPAGNPFNGPNQRKEIWAFGLRNPWRFSFDRATGDLYIGDVGQEMYEEINFQKAGSSGGQNYGWHYREGFHAYTGTPPAGVSFTNPVFEYDHSQGCSITGGYVYRGQALPEWRGIYLYADYCQGRVWGLIHQGGQWVNQPLFQPAQYVTSFGQDEAGELYLLTSGGDVLKLFKKP